MTKAWIIGLSLMIMSSASALEVIGSDGISHAFSFEYFRLQGIDQVTTTRHRDGRMQSEIWQGLRLDNWLMDNGFTRWQNIRFEAEDNYVINMHRAEFDSLQCWMVFQQGQTTLDSLNYRVIFPALRDLHWVRGVQRIILEDFNPMLMPQRLLIWEKEAQNLEVYDDPAPFVRVKAYALDDIIQGIMRLGRAEVVLVSSDGLRLRMEYPRHLGGAILEIGEGGALNLKSAQIPGGLWLKDIMYIQADNLVLITAKGLAQLVELSLLLGWELTPESTFQQIQAVELRRMKINEVMTEADWQQDAAWLEIRP